MFTFELTDLFPQRTENDFKLSELDTEGKTHLEVYSLPLLFLSSMRL